MVFCDARIAATIGTETLAIGEVNVNTDTI